MNVNGLAKTSLAIAVSWMILFPAGVSSANPSSAGEGGSGFIQRFDKDGDGKVSRDEFIAGSEGFFNRLDANGDGYVDAAEAQNRPSHHGMKGRGFIQRFDKDGDGKVSRDEFVTGSGVFFSRLDANGDGYVDAAEAQNRPHHHGMEGRDGRGFIQRFDKDGDGKVSRDEFMGGSEEFFNRLDANGDGYVDATETPQRPPFHGQGTTGRSK